MLGVVKQVSKKTLLAFMSRFWSVRLNLRFQMQHIYVHSEKDRVWSLSYVLFLMYWRGRYY